MSQRGGVTQAGELNMDTALLNTLNQKSAYNHPIKTVEWRETHISWVVLTGTFVYKIKKPVNFGFLDFSSVSLRKHYCEEELRLNRRTAPDLYLDVVPLNEHEGYLNFKGKGKVVDYAVRMRQFDPDSLLSSYLQSNEADGLFLQALGYELGEFHQSVQVAAEDSEYGTRAAVAYPVNENFKQIIPSLQEKPDIENIVDIKIWSLAMLDHLDDAFIQRKKQGYIRECHGDLHLGNIAVLQGRAVPFDCIEFSKTFRWIDTASDLAFLLMDVRFNGYSQQANVVLNSYLEYTFDYSLLDVLKFYLVYRAMVRAKVLLLRLSQGDGDKQERINTMEFFHGYVRFCQDVLKPRAPFLMITSGVSGSGKSTFAREFCSQADAIHLRSDVTRKHLAGLKPLQSSSDLIKGIYSAEFSQQTFARLESAAKLVLQSGYSVVVDATFLTQADRQPFIKLGDELGVKTLIGFLDVPHEVLVERIVQRGAAGGDPSEATVEVMEKQLETQQPFNDLELPLLVSACDDEGNWNIAAIMEKLTD